MLNLIPMAGSGSRFKEEGFRVPKPMIPVLGKPMSVAACLSFPPADRWIFLAHQEHVRLYPIRDNLAQHFPDVEVFPVAQKTEGQACTCLLAKDKFQMDEELFIASCDYQTVYDAAAYERLTADPSIDVVVWTFRGRGLVKKDPRAFAYCRTEGDRVTEVVEKELISGRPDEDPAVVGSFYFRKGELFVRGAEEMIRKNIRVKNEFYVGTSINQLIAEGKKAVIFDVEKFISFGDPLEMKVFQYWEEYFNGLEDFSYKSRFGPQIHFPQTGGPAR